MTRVKYSSEGVFRLVCAASIGAGGEEQAGVSFPSSVKLHV